MIKYLPRLRWLTAAGLAFVSLAPAHAAEGGASNYPYGALSSYAALLPAPGQTALYGYVVQYSASRIADDQGNKVPGVDAEFFAAAPRFVHTWKSQFAGANLSTGLTFEGLSSSVSVPGDKQRSTGPTLLGIEPLYLTGAIGSLHLLTGPVAYFPLGSYDASKLANSTTAYISYAYQVNASWLPTPLWDFSLAFATEFKDRNKQTGYDSGTQAGVTYGISHRPFADTRWDLGVTGFYTRQLTDDKIDGTAVAGGARTRKFAIGPKVAFWLTPTTPLIFQWHRESRVRNAAKGDLFWFEFGIPLQW